MKKYLGSYLSQSDVQNAIDNGTLKKPYVAAINNNSVDYDSATPDYKKMPLTFEILSGGNLTWYVYNTAFTQTISCRKNGGDWFEITSTDGDGVSIPVSVGDKVEVKGLITEIWSNFSTSTCIFNISGNICSLFFGDDFSGATKVKSRMKGAFFGTNVVSAENLKLPAAASSYEVNYQQYGSLFQNCTKLVKAPELPSTYVVTSCYAYMFNGCTSLTSAPELPATTLAESCYNQMFKGCTALTSAPELPATTLKNGCYSGMFEGCTSLTTAPELPATTLANNCYGNMFKDCTSLNYIKCLATDKSANYCTLSWIYNVASSGTFVKNRDMESWPTTGYDGIPEGWTVVDE